jgi:hypothetical protein
MDELRALRSAHEAEWLAIAGVVAVGIGSAPDGRRCVVVSIDHESPQLRQQVLARAPGAPVEIWVTGTPRAL